MPWHAGKGERAWKWQAGRAWRCGQGNNVGQARCMCGRCKGVHARTVGVIEKRTLTGVSRVAYARLHPQQPPTLPHTSAHILCVCATADRHPVAEGRDRGAQVRGGLHLPLRRRTVHPGGQQRVGAVRHVQRRGRGRLLHRYGVCEFVWEVWEVWRGHLLSPACGGEMQRWYPGLCVAGPAQHHTPPRCINTLLPCSPRPAARAAENCLVVAMGAMRVDGVFQATTIEFPTTEPRDALPMAAQVRGKAGPRAQTIHGVTA